MAIETRICKVITYTSYASDGKVEKKTTEVVFEARDLASELTKEWRCQAMGFAATDADRTAIEAKAQTAINAKLKL